MSSPEIDMKKDSIAAYRSKMEKRVRKLDNDRNLGAKEKALAMVAACMERRRGGEDVLHTAAYVKKEISIYEKKSSEIYAELKEYMDQEYEKIELLCKDVWKTRCTLNDICIKMLNCEEKNITLSSEQIEEIKLLQKNNYLRSRAIKEMLSEIHHDVVMVKALMAKDWECALAKLKFFYLCYTSSDSENEINWESLYPDCYDEKAFMEFHSKRQDIYSLF